MMQDELHDLQEKSVATSYSPAWQSVVHVSTRIYL